MNPDLTGLLLEAQDGGEDAVAKILPLVYPEIRALAAHHLQRERTDHTLQPTALANEAYLRLVDQSRVQWQGKAHFMGIVSTMIRRVLVDHARARAAQKRGGRAERVALESADLQSSNPVIDVLSIDEALTALAARSERHAEIVQLKVFGGLTNDEIAELVGVSESTVKNEWRFAKAWLADYLDDE